MHKIVITQSSHSPVSLHVNGQSKKIAIGAEVDVNDAELAVLASTPLISFRFANMPGAGAATPAIAASFDAEAVIIGTVDEVAARLASLTPAELEAVRAAEDDREVARKGVMSAIDKLITQHNEE